jgi:hypothetical protein
MQLARVIVVSLASFSTVLAQEFQNASFESPIVPSSVGNWIQQPTGPDVIWTGTGKWGIARGASSWGSAGHTGPQYAFLQSSNDPAPGTLSQTVSGFVVGNSYILDYWMARRNGNLGANIGTDLTVTINGHEVIVDRQFSSGDGEWLPYASHPFVAHDPTLTFTFSVPPPTGDHSLLLDSLSFRVVPEPVIVPLLGWIGVGLLGCRRRCGVR